VREVVESFSTDPKSKYQKSNNRFHKLCILIGKPKGMVSKKIHKVIQTHNRVARNKPLRASEYDVLSAHVQNALDACIGHLDKAETHLLRISSELKEAPLK
jgi:hypothetical protein